MGLRDYQADKLGKEIQVAIGRNKLDSDYAVKVFMPDNPRKDCQVTIYKKGKEGTLGTTRLLEKAELPEALQGAILRAYQVVAGEEEGGLRIEEVCEQYFDSCIKAQSAGLK